MNIQTIKNGIVLPLLLLSIVGFTQQTGKIDTDRPDQTESAFLVPKGYFQGEFGVNKENYGEDFYTIVHPVALLKYGLSNRVELRSEIRTETEYYHMIPRTRTQTIINPVEIGSKIRFWEEKGLLPKTSLIVHVGLPFAASPKWGGDSVNYSFRFTCQSSINDNLAIGYNFGYERDALAKSFFYTIAPGMDLGERWYAYVEAFGNIYQNYSEHNLDGGIAYYFSPDTKMDLSAGFGLGSSELKSYVALGFSFRIPLTKKGLYHKL